MAPPPTTTTSRTRMRLFLPRPHNRRVDVDQTGRVPEAVNLPSPCLVVLVGPGASGKSTWATAHFPPDAIVSSDRLRALVGSGEDDIAASSDAFELLDEVVRRRIARRLTTVIDTLGLDADRRQEWLALARRHGLPCVAVGFGTPAEECRARNRARSKRIPADVLTSQLRTWASTRDLLPAEGYDDVLAPRPVRVVPEAFVGRPPPLGVRTRARPACDSGCISAASPSPADPRRRAERSATSRSRPRRPASTRSM